MAGAYRIPLAEAVEAAQHIEGQNLQQLKENISCLQEILDLVLMSVGLIYRSSKKQECNLDVGIFDAVWIFEEGAMELHYD